MVSQRGPFQQPLHPVRGGVPGVLGQRPAVLARQITEQPADVFAGLGERLDPTEVHTQAAHQLSQFLTDPLGLYHGRSGHLVIFRCRHNTG
jgi:hypothetical protein